SLARSAAGASSRALVGDLSEKLSLGVLTAALVPVVAGHGHEVLLDEALNLRIGKGELPAHDAIVSGAAQQAAVHLPPEDRAALRGRLLPGLPEVRQPGNLGPFCLAGVRLDDRMNGGEFLDRDRLSSGARSIGENHGERYTKKSKPPRCGTVRRPYH